MDIPYCEHFGLTEKPFSLTPDPAFYFESRSHKEALDHLGFFLDQQEGFALIYGDVGTGKTTLSRIFLKSLDPEIYDSALILNPIMDEQEFLREVLAEFSITISGPLGSTGLDALRVSLLDRHGKGKRSIIVVDEAQLIKDELFEFIRVLSNFETDKNKMLQIVFFAQPEIIGRLQRDSMRYLSQRLTVIYELNSLEIDEVGRYVSYRLFKAGSRALPEFSDGAVKIISIASGGCPRLINILADRCMLILYSRSKAVVNRAIARAALRELNIVLLVGRKKRLPKRIYVILSVAALLLLILFVTIGKVVFLPAPIVPELPKQETSQRAGPKGSQEHHRHSEDDYRPESGGWSRK
jgi:general secretion pathway protein A